VSTGEAVRLSATLADGGAPITSASVSVEVEDPRFGVQTFELRDDGSGADLQANDGSYAAFLGATCTCGVERLRFRAVGSASAGEFIREALVLATVATAGDAHGDPCAADDDDDGLTDSAEIAAGSDPARADTDGDGFDDGCELAAGADAVDPAVVPDSPCSAPTPRAEGDVDCDGRVDGVDLHVLLGATFGATARGCEMADVNADGRIGAADAIALLRLLAAAGVPSGCL
jgi:hypothetical protein